MLTIASGYDPLYLTKAVATGRENYYLSAVTEHGEPPGIWTGRGCPELGLPIRSEGRNKVLERLVGARLGQRTAGTDYIWLLDRLEESMRALIERQASDPRRINEAHRLVRSTSRNTRLIISEINLQLLTRAVVASR